MSRGRGKWIAAALLCSACTEVELCYNAEHPHTLPLSIGFNWDEAAVEEKPDSMYMVFSRIINTRHYVYGVSSEGWEEEGEAVPEALSEEPQEESRRVEGGDYIVIAVTKNHEQVELLEADEFQADTSIRLDSLRLQVKDIKTPDLPGFDTQKWNNLNPAYTYIANTITSYHTGTPTQLKSQVNKTKTVLPITGTYKDDYSGYSLRNLIKRQEEEGF